VALRRLRSPAVATFLKDADKGVVLEAARAIYDVPIPEAMPALAALAGHRHDAALHPQAAPAAAAHRPDDVGRRPVGAIGRRPRGPGREPPALRAPWSS